MNEDHKTQMKTQQVEYNEDEIELIDILRVIWKWKYLILLGTIVFGLAATIISFTMPKIYRIDMTLQPGITSIDQHGNKVYIDSVENIKTIVQMDVLKGEITKYIQKDGRKNPSNSFKFKVSVPKNSEIIKISYESESVDFGINVMESIYQALRIKYNELVNYYRDNYDKEIQSVKAEIDILETESLYYEQRFKRTQKRIIELEALINDINKENIILIRQRNEVIQKKKNGEINMPVVLYNNMIQQNLSLANQYRNDIKEYLYKIEERDIKNIQRGNRKLELLNKLNMLEDKKGFVQNIKILQPPTATAHPVKPKIKLNVVFALLAGLFLMVFLSFFLEYLNKHKNTKGNSP